MRDDSRVASELETRLKESIDLANDYAVYELCFDPIGRRYKRALSTGSQESWEANADRFLDDAARLLFSKKKRNECVCVFLVALALDASVDSLVVQIEHDASLRTDSASDSIKTSLIELFEADAFSFSQNDDASDIIISQTEFASLLVGKRAHGDGRGIACEPFVWPASIRSEASLLRELGKASSEIESIFNEPRAKRRRERLVAISEGAFASNTRALTSISLRATIGGNADFNQATTMEPQVPDIRTIVHQLENNSFSSLSDAEKRVAIDAASTLLSKIPATKLPDVFDGATLSDAKKKRINDITGVGETMTLAKAAEYLSVSRMTISRYGENGRVRFVGGEDGKPKLYLVEDLEKLTSENLKPGGWRRKGEK